MSRTLKLLGAEAALATSVGAASNFNNAQRVRVYNSAGAGTDYLVTVANVGGTTLGSFSLGGGSFAIIDKGPTDELFAENAAVLGAPIAVKD